MKTRKQLEAEIKSMENAIGWGYGTLIILAREIGRWDSRLMNEPSPDTIIRVTNDMERHLAGLGDLAGEKPPTIDQIIAKSKKS